MDIKSILDPKRAAFDSKVVVSSHMIDASLMPGAIVVTKQNCYYVFLRGTDYTKEGLFIRLNKLPEKSMFHTKVMEYSNPAIKWKEPYYYDFNRGIVTLEVTKIKAMLYLGGSDLDKAEFQRMMLLIRSYLLGEYILDKDGKFFPAPYISNPAVRAIYRLGYEPNIYYKDFVVTVPMAVSMENLPFEVLDNPPVYNFKYDYPNHPYNAFMQVQTNGGTKGITFTDAYLNYQAMENKTSDSSDTGSVNNLDSEKKETPKPAPKKAVDRGRIPECLQVQRCQVTLY